MLRRLVTILSVLSLVLCVATCVLGVWSYAHLITFMHTTHTARRLVTFACGDVEFSLSETNWSGEEGWAFDRQAPPRRTADDWAEMDAVFGSARGWWWAYGFGYGGWQNGTYPRRIVAVSAPAWSIALALAILPAATLVRRLRHWQRLFAGRCAACGYDLRATPDRCPECGTVSALSKISD